jgi:YesN/AraC family two-component response regulator
MEKILIIDDEKATLSMFRLLLGAYGFAVLTAENGKEGLEVFKKERPAAVLTDIKMPGIDGLAVLRCIKQIQPDTQVIVITGHGDRDLEKQALALDAAHFIHKPIKKEALESALKKIRTNMPSGLF